MEREELASWLRLTLAPGVGNETARKLLRTFGLPAAIFSQSSQALQHLLGPALAGAFQNKPPELAAQIDATWAWLQDAPLQRTIIVLGDADRKSVV